MLRAGYFINAMFDISAYDGYSISAQPDPK